MTNNIKDFPTAKDMNEIIHIADMKRVDLFLSLVKDKLNCQIEARSSFGNIGLGNFVIVSEFELTRSQIKIAEDILGQKGFNFTAAIEDDDGNSYPYHSWYIGWL